MRGVLAITLALTISSCDRGDPRPAVLASPVAAVTSTRAPVEVGVSPAAAEPEHGCGGACGGSCAGPHGCNGSCGGMAVAEQPEAPVPANAVWTDLQVTGMHCGGCARRIKGALARTGGVLGVEVDLATAKVRVATAAGIDGRSLAAPVIDGLGYQVQ